MFHYFCTCPTCRSFCACSWDAARTSSPLMDRIWSPSNNLPSESTTPPLRISGTKMPVSLLLEENRGQKLSVPRLHNLLYDLWVNAGRNYSVGPFYGNCDYITTSFIHSKTTINIPFTHSGEPQSLSRTRSELQAKDVPQVLLPVGLLVPEDTKANALGGEPQHTDGLIVGGLPQVYTANLGGSEEQNRTEQCEALQITESFE